MNKRIPIIGVLLLFAISVFAENDLLKMRVSLSVKNKAIYSVLRILEDDYDEIRFSYSPDLLDLQKKVSVDFYEEELGVVLSSVLSGTQIEYVELNKNIALRIKREKKDNKNNAVASSSENNSLNTVERNEGENYVSELGNREFIVKGVVVDETGESLPGVTIQVKNTFNGVSTDISGVYQVDVRSGGGAKAVLILSYLGMEKQEVHVNGRHTVNVVMKDSKKDLDELVVVGYGTKRKSDVVGSMTTVTSKELSYAIPASIDQMLEGVVPGLMVSNSSSEPGAKTEVRIRGESSIDGVNTPLYIVDGVPYTTEMDFEIYDGFSYNPLASINPDDIESVTVLKDAAATSIYGANASNGVILITTKRGRDEKVDVNITANVSVQTRINNCNDLLNTAEYVELMTEACINAGYTEVQAAEAVGRTDVDTNWPSLVYQTGINQNYNLSARGGSERMKCYSSVSFSKQQGVIKGNSLQRVMARVNLDHKIGNKGSLSYTLSPSFSKKEYFIILGNVNEILPNIPVYNEDGSYNTDIKYNPLAILDQNEYYGKGSRISGSAKFQYDFFKWLEFETKYGFDSYDNTNYQYLSMLNQTGAAFNGKADRTNVKNFRWYWNGMARFRISKDDHKLSGLVSLELDDSESNTIQAIASNFPNDQMRELKSGSVQEKANSRKTETSQVSYFAKADYSCKSKYFLTVSFRNDASSIFGGDVKASNKGAVGASWLISKENWFASDLPAFELLKLRASVGTSGNSRIGSYASRGVYSYNGIDYNNQHGSAPLYGDNPGLSWETSLIYNVGVDFKWNRYLSGTIECYLKNNYDLLNETDVSETTGFSTSTRNLGDSRNSGLEFDLKSCLVDKEDLMWRVNFTCAFERSIFTKLHYGNGRISGNRIMKEGESVRTLYLVRWAGVNPDDGSPQWYDKEGNVVDYRSASNAVIVGSALPDFYGSFTNNLTYKGFGLRIFTTYTYGSEVYNSNRASAESDGAEIATKNQNKNQLDRWQNSGDITDVPKIVLNNESHYSSTRFMEDGSHLNIKNISLSYLLRKDLADKLKVNTLRFSFAVDNVWVFAGLKSLSTANGKLDSYYPDMRTYQFSMSFNF